MITIDLSTKSGFFTVDGLDYHQNYYTIEYDNKEGTDEERNFSLRNIFTGDKIISSRGYAEISGVNSWKELLFKLNRVAALNNIDVSIQDQTSPPILANFNKLEALTELSVATAIDDFTINIVNATGFETGKYISIFSVQDNRFFLANILSINGTELTIDTPLDFAFPVGSSVTSGEKNINLDGSVTPLIYALRNTNEQIGTAFDITRIMFACKTVDPVDLSKFGDIVGGLTKGIILRKKDGNYRNIFNAKTNEDLAKLMYDWMPELATNPATGQDGFLGRLTFAGQNKIGVAIRLDVGEDLQLIVQDDLTQLTSFEMVAEGHTVIY